jgi:uncharacterized phiE125 gp8 family phage protein
MLRPVRTLAPAELPVTVAEAKENSRIDHTDSDTLVESLIGAAVSYLDGYTGVLGRCIVSQDWRQDFEDWDWRLRLPFPDVSSVTVKYQDENDAEQTVSSADYEIIEEAFGASVVFRDSFEEPSLYDDMVAPISVTFTAGYGGASDVPEALKSAIKLMVGHWYEHREAAGDTDKLPYGFDMLIAPFRRRPA